MTAKQQAVAENIQTFTHNLVILKLPRGPLKFNLVSFPCEISDILYKVRYEKQANGMSDLFLVYFPKLLKSVHQPPQLRLIQLMRARFSC